MRKQASNGQRAENGHQADQFIRLSGERENVQTEAALCVPLVLLLFLLH